MKITTRTTIVSNVQLNDNIRIWLLEEEAFKSAPETWKCRHRNNVFGLSIPDPRSRNMAIQSTTVKPDINLTFLKCHRNICCNVFTCNDQISTSELYGRLFLAEIH